MMGLTVANVTNNAAKIAQAIARDRENILLEFGRDHAEAASELMKDSSGISAPNSPPNVHSSQTNLETYDHIINQAKTEVVSGPIKISASLQMSRPLPNVMEFGGIVTVKRNNRRSRARRTRGRRRNDRLRAMVPRSLTLHYRARPVVVPAAILSLERMQSRLRQRGLGR